MTNEERIRILEEKRIKINEVSSSFCTAKWLQTTLYLQNGYNHSCHHPSPHKIPVDEVTLDPASLHNSSFKKEQRAMMLSGERPTECDYCWKIEDLNKDYFSDRHYKTADYWAWDRFTEISSSNASVNVFPAYLEVSFSNACNFKCVYCSPEISSKWLEEITKFGPYPIEKCNYDLDWLKKVGKYPYKHSDDNPYVNAFWEWFPEALPHLKVFRITGGEPLMSKDTWKVLEYIRNNPQPNLELAINTNLCVEPKLINRLILEINSLKSCVNKIDVYTSLESTGEQAMYARFGLDYDTWTNNMHLLLTETSCVVSIMTTINILSLPTFVNFIEDIMKLRTIYNYGFEHNRIPLSINYLRWPPHLSVSLLPIDIREQYANNIIEVSQSWLKYYRKDEYARIYLEEWDQIKRFCDFLKIEPVAIKERSEFVKFIQELDYRRGSNFEEVFPEFSQFIHEW
jgi:organic radical activating enzyme